MPSARLFEPSRVPRSCMPVPASHRKAWKSNGNLEMRRLNENIVPTTWPRSLMPLAWLWRLGSPRVARVLHAPPRLPQEGTQRARGRVALAHDLAPRVDAVSDAVVVVAAEGAEILHTGTRLPQEGVRRARGRVAGAHDLATLVDAKCEAVGAAQRAQVDEGVSRRRGLGDGHRAGPDGQEQEEGNDDREAESDPLLHDSLLPRVDSPCVVRRITCPRRWGSYRHDRMPVRSGA